jgi:hypothetical protein
VILKPRIDIYVAMILGGIFFTFIGFASAFAIGLYAGIIPAILGVLGLLWITVSVVGLARRRKFAITIDSSGITVPTGSVFRVGERVHIPREAIATIGRDESIRGRLVAIALRSGGKVPIQARQYCELKTFLAHCKSHGLPTA